MSGKESLYGRPECSFAVRCKRRVLIEHDDLVVKTSNEGIDFWDLEIEQTDVWRREAGDWFLSPDKL